MLIIAVGFGGDTSFTDPYTCSIRVHDGYKVDPLDKKAVTQYICIERGLMADEIDELLVIENDTVVKTYYPNIPVIES